MHTSKELSNFVIDALTGIMLSKGYDWNKGFRSFLRAEHGVDKLLFVSIARHKSGLITIHLPVHARFRAVETIRNKYRVWPTSLSEKQIKFAIANSSTIVRAYPKELGAASAVDLYSAEEVAAKLDVLKAILNAQIDWLDRFSDISAVQDALESEKPGDWPVPLPIQRYEVLLSIYALCRNQKSFDQLVEFISGKPRLAGYQEIMAFAHSIAEVFKQST